MGVVCRDTAVCLATQVIPDTVVTLEVVYPDIQVTLELVYQATPVCQDTRDSQDTQAIAVYRGTVVCPDTVDAADIQDEA